MGSGIFAADQQPILAANDDRANDAFRRVVVDGQIPAFRIATAMVAANNVAIGLVTKPTISRQPPTSSSPPMAIA